MTLATPLSEWYCTRMRIPGRTPVSKCPKGMQPVTTTATLLIIHGSMINVAMQMAEAVYKKLDEYAKSKHGIKKPKFTWDAIEPDVKKLMRTTINDSLNGSLQSRFRNGDPLLSKQDLQKRIERWQQAIKERFRSEVRYSFNPDDPWVKEEANQAIAALKPPKDFIPKFVDV